MVSADRSTEINFPTENGVTSISVSSELAYVQCYVEIMFPGGSVIPKLTINYSGDTINDVFFSDIKDFTYWTTPLTINELEINVEDSHPHIYFLNAHDVGKLTARGVFCV